MGIEVIVGGTTEKVVIKRVDRQGRITIPKEWRDLLKAEEFVMVLMEDRIELYPKRANLSKFIDSIEVEELPDDWHEFKRKVYRL